MIEERVGIGTTSPSFALDVAGTSHINATTSGWAMTMNNNENAAGGFSGSTGVREIMFQTYGSNVGDIFVTGSTITYSTSSDYRLKENLRPIQGALDRVMQLPVYSFDYKRYPQIRVEGFLAHEAAKVVPYAVHGKKDEVDAQGNPVYQGVDYGKLTPLLTGAVQELKSLFDGDHDDIAKLKADNEAQAKALQDLKVEFETYRKAHP